MTDVNCRTDPEWLERVVAGLSFAGYCVVEGVLDEQLLSETRAAMYGVRDRIVEEVGEARLAEAGEVGVLRLMVKYEPHFLRLLELQPVLDVIDATVSDSAVLHLQNGLILPPIEGEDRADVFQRRFHRDFPRIINGYLMSINTFFALDEFTASNGGTLVVPGTHQREEMPSQTYLDDEASSVECPPGSMIVFDSTLLHAAGANYSDADRVAINQQFTRSYVKQQVDYVRALGDELVVQQEPRTQQLLGWYTRVVTSLEEYYRPPEERLYRSGQG